MVQTEDSVWRGKAWRQVRGMYLGNSKMLDTTRAQEIAIAFPLRFLRRNKAPFHPRKSPVGTASGKEGQWCGVLGKSPQWASPADLRSWLSKNELYSTQSSSKGNLFLFTSHGDQTASKGAHFLHIELSSPAATQTACLTIPGCSWDAEKHFKKWEYTGEERCDVWENVNGQSLSAKKGLQKP